MKTLDNQSSDPPGEPDETVAGNGSESDDDSLTKLLERATSGNGDAANALWDLVYSEIHKMAHAQLVQERNDGQLQPTMVVHEVFLRLWSKDGPVPTWTSSRHFFANVARVMGQFIIDNARARNRLKRGGGFRRTDLRIVEGELSDLNSALEIESDVAIEALMNFEKKSPRQAEVVWLRFVIGLNISQTARVLGISDRTVIDDWKFARASLLANLAGK